MGGAFPYSTDMKECLALNEISWGIISALLFTVDIDYQFSRLFDTRDVIPLLKLKRCTVATGTDDSLRTYSPLEPATSFIFKLIDKG